MRYLDLMTPRWVVTFPGFSARYGMSWMTANLATLCSRTSTAASSRFRRYFGKPQNDSTTRTRNGSRIR